MTLQVHVLRLSPGEDLRESLVSSFAALSRDSGVTAACVISSVGSLSVSVLRHAAQSAVTRLEAPLELLTLSGTLSPSGVHLHASVADAQGRVTGGHVMPGCIVRTTCEIVLALLPEWDFARRHDAATGYLELFATRRG